MRVFLLGGTGAIGSHALPALIRAGHDVSALARSPEKAARVREQGATPVEVSMFDRVGLEQAFRGHDAIVNLATSMPTMSTFVFRRAWKATERVRVDGSAAVVDAALHAGVPHLVQESVSMVYPDRGNEWIDEAVEPDPYPNARANLSAEASATRFSEAGGTGVVLRLGLFYGPGARHSEQFLSMARHHVVPLVGRQDSYLSSIHMTDGGTAVIAALHVPAGIYNIVDDAAHKAWLRRRARCRSRHAAMDPGPGSTGSPIRRQIDIADTIGARQQQALPRRRQLGTPLPQRP